MRSLFQRKAWRQVYLLSMLLVVAGITAVAQTSRGTVSGLVSDGQKSAVPDAGVELTAIATNVTRVTSSNQSGLYRFDAVDPGPYTLKVKAVGFHTFSARQFEVSAAQSVTLDAPLQLGEVQQVIEVNAESVQLQTEAAVRGKSITTNDILELPFQSRNPVMLATTAPGVVSSKFATPSNSFVVNGGRGRSNNFMIDGTDNNDISVAGQAFQLLNPGSVQEVSVQTSNFDAEFGRAGGGVVNVITSSGSNSVHGTAGFVLDSTRDDAISSSLSQDPAIRARGKNLPGTEQQFDGTLGGPILKDRTFFHLSYLELRQFSQSSTEMISPTAAGRAVLRNLFPSGRNANADLLQTITAGYDGVFKNFNVPLGSGRPDAEFGHIVIPYSQQLRIRQYAVKVDHRFTQNDTLAGRVLVDDQLLPTGGETLSFPSFNTSSTQKTLSSALYETHIFSPAMTNEARLAFTRYNLDVPLDPVNPLGKTLPQIAIAGINTTASSVYGIRSTFPQGRIFNNYVFQDTVSIVRGTHSLRVGVDLMDQRARQAAPFNYRGILSYASSSLAGQPTYSGLANFLDNFGGGGGSAQRAFGTATYYPSLFRQAYFAQDRWRAANSLTVSLGLRYEYFGTPMNVIQTPAYIGIFNVDPVTFQSPFALPNKVNPDKNNFAPVAGLVYSPSADSGVLGWLIGEKKTALRMGFGMGYDSFFNNITSNSVAAAPNAVASTSNSQVGTAAIRGTENFSSLIPAVAAPITPLLSQSGIDQNLRNPYYMRWSAGIQRELPGNFLLDVSYVGSRGIRLFAQEDLNPLVPLELQTPVPASVPASRKQARLDPLSGQRSIRTNGGSSIYHSGQVELKRRFRSGFSLTAAYTYSKVIDNVSEIFNYGNTSNIAAQAAPSIYGGLSIDRAVGFFDRTHRAVFTYNYELPFMKSQRGLIGRFVGGWEIAGITTYESGTPYSVVNGQDADGLGGANDRPDFNPAGRTGVRAVPGNSATGYVNPDDNNNPIDPRTAEYIGLAANDGKKRTRTGNLGRNTLRGPGLKDWDVNAIKNIRLSERFHLQFRAEFYNVFNTPQYGTVSVSPFAPAQSLQSIPASVFNSQPGQFLRETSADGGGRVIRWQLRLRF